MQSRLRLFPTTRVPLAVCWLQGHTSLISDNAIEPEDVCSVDVAKVEAAFKARWETKPESRQA